eukprot:scaffold76643_cov19-Tisochrysis_lutea.AAC.2
MPSCTALVSELERGPGTEREQERPIDGGMASHSCCKHWVRCQGLANPYHACLSGLAQDYNVYTNVMYLHVAVVGLLLAGLAVLALTVNKVQKSKDLKKWVKVLHVSTGVSARIHVPGAVRQICNGG